MDLIPGFQQLLQAVAVVMTTPTRHTFLALASGWLFARRHTVTAMIRASGQLTAKHFCSFHRFFSAAAWSLDGVGFALFRLLEPLLEGQTILLVVDDTLARKRGRKIYGAGWHHDPLLKNVQARTSWGHSWVVLGVIVRFPQLAERTFCLPMGFRLYLNHVEATRQRRTHRTRPELALQMVGKLCQAWPQRRFHLLGDAAYGGRVMRDGLPANCDLTSYLRLDARLYDAPPPHSGRGRPRLRGERLPSPQELLEQRLRRVTVDVYGRRDEVRIGSCLARTFHHPRQPVRVVVIQSLSGKRGRQAFYSTCSQAAAEQVLQWYALRWTAEVAFQCAKQHLGFEEPPCWTRRAVERTAPMAMLLYSLVVLWFGMQAHRRWKLQTMPWYPGKAAPSFADMLAQLRQETLENQITALPLEPQVKQKFRRLLENTAALAA